MISPSNSNDTLQALVSEGCVVEVLAQRHHVQYIITQPPRPEEKAKGSATAATAVLHEALEVVNEAMRDMSEAIGASGNNATPRQHSRSAFPVSSLSLLACLQFC